MLLNTEPASTTGNKGKCRILV